MRRRLARVCVCIGIVRDSICCGGVCVLWGGHGQAKKRAKKDKGKGKDGKKYKEYAWG